MAIFEGSFKSKSIKKFYYKGTTKGLNVKNTAKLQDILNYINSIEGLPPENKLFRAHEHKGQGKET